MNINLVCPIIVLDNESNSNIRKNDIKSFKILVNKNDKSLVNIKLTEPKDIKTTLKSKIKEIIGSNNFHLEQVYTLGEEKYYTDNAVDIIYLAVTNIEHIKKLSSDYLLVDFKIKNNSIKFAENTYSFKTIEKIKNNNIEYVHKINADDIVTEKKLLEIIIAYKYLRGRIDYSDIIFKFMGETFTLEDVRIVYELIKEKTTDKSNFRKKIIKYCEEVSIESSKKGYRPSKVYKFKVLNGDVWL
ncbi:MAG: hypothetical protein HFE81_06720 [Bacilli bacterium]|nr:hypothetical protein [Bacilli bacterium]